MSRRKIAFTCKICGKRYEKTEDWRATKYCCPEHQKIGYGLSVQQHQANARERRKQATKTAKQEKEIRIKNRKQIISIEKLAREEGISYGQYVAKYGC